MNLPFSEARQKIRGIADPERRVRKSSVFLVMIDSAPCQAPPFAEDRILKIANRAAQDTFHDAAIECMKKIINKKYNKAYEEGSHRD